MQPFVPLLESLSHSLKTHQLRVRRPFGLRNHRPEEIMTQCSILRGLGSYAVRKFALGKLKRRGLPRNILESPYPFVLEELRGQPIERGNRSRFTKYGKNYPPSPHYL